MPLFELVLLLIPRNVTIPSASRDTLDSSFSNSYISDLSHLITMANTTSAMLSSGDSGYLCSLREIPLVFVH